jgi:hypothetical protein
MRASHPAIWHASARAAGGRAPLALGPRLAAHAAGSGGCSGADALESPDPDPAGDADYEARAPPRSARAGAAGAQARRTTATGSHAMSSKAHPGPAAAMGGAHA